MRTREIKFRVWSVTDRMMRSHEWLSAAQVVYSALTRERVDIHVMQYTGLKDKNGKEIYEGDIIQYKQYTAFRRWWNTTDEIPEIEKAFGNSKLSNTQISRNTIRFADGSFRLTYEVDGYVIARGEKIKTGHTTHADYEDKWWDFEVIGNIYANPELLKQ